MRCRKPSTSLRPTCPCHKAPIWCRRFRATTLAALCSEPIVLAAAPLVVVVFHSGGVVALVLNALTAPLAARLGGTLR
jgi:hypothetical protein